MLTFILLCNLATAADRTSKAAPETATVVSVYDGDTFTLDNGDRVRLLLVNTPELKPAEEYGVEAREAAKSLILNREVTLHYGTTPRDGYGRLLAGASVDGQDLAELLISLGLGHIFVIPPNTTDLAPLLTAQKNAKLAGRGIWSTSRYSGSLHITSFHADAPGDDNKNVNGEYIRVCNVSVEPIDLAGYSITDIGGNRWELPSMVVPAGSTIKVHSGVGVNQTDPSSQLSLYLGQSGPVWNNERDEATIFDRHGTTVDSRSHPSKN